MLTVPTTLQECENLEQEILEGRQEYSAELDPYVTAYFYGVKGIDADVDHKWRRQMYRLGRRKLEEAIEFAKSFFRENGCGFQVLADSGWFSPLDMAMGKLAQLAETEPDAVSKELCTWFSDRLEDIEHHLVEAHLTRGRFIRDAFRAHKEERFGLSVLCFLSQADGISCDKFGASVFRGDQRKEITNQVSEDSSGGIEALFHPLKGDIPIWLPEKQRSTPFEGLNRHLILHGVDTAYDTLENSLKAISFIWWIHQLTDMWGKEQ